MGCPWNAAGAKYFMKRSYRVPISKYSILSTSARFLGHLGYSESSLAYWLTRYAQMARLSQSLRSPSTRVGTQCWGLMATNSGLRCSPSNSARCFKLSSTPSAAAVSIGPRHGAEAGCSRSPWRSVLRWGRVEEELLLL